ncbi:tRNA pseudouridine synthase 1 [Mycena venus]|uniref:tRNA pseudouridine synthase 1 n=1 Tax=Mycena venus TaxID=2733690 RepID=A0A8H6YCL3_9AGAR|nr:tRNA pseudouridine synthase 1 [Mycena venus]
MPLTDPEPGPIPAAPTNQYLSARAYQMGPVPPQVGQPGPGFVPQSITIPAQITVPLNTGARAPTGPTVRGKAISSPIIQGAALGADNNYRASAYGGSVASLNAAEEGGGRPPSRAQSNSALSRKSGRSDAALPVNVGVGETLTPHPPGPDAPGVEHVVALDVELRAVRREFVCRPGVFRGGGGYRDGPRPCAEVEEGVGVVEAFGVVVYCPRAEMDVPAVAKRSYEDGDVPGAKRVKASEDAEMEVDDAQAGERTIDDAAAQESLGGADAGAKEPKKRRDGFPKNLKKGKGKEKDNKNPGRRRRGTRNDEALEEGTTNADAEANGGTEGAAAPEAHVRAAHWVLRVGVQRDADQDAKTIENALFDAMVRAGAVSQDNADDPVKVNIARAARTDAGVHAAGNVVSLKMITHVPGVPDITARINEELPPEIRLWGAFQNSFNPRTLCDSRKYTYFFPTYMLIPPKPSSALYRVLTEHAASLTPPTPSPIAGHPFWADGAADAPTEESADMVRKRAWRAEPAHVEQLRTIAQKYIATHNFHNFTVNGAFSDRSNQRILKNIEIADPVVYGETEWISVLFHGQSFMMHQVVSSPPSLRKMMSILVLSCRTGTPPQIIDELYGPRDVFIPKMPALGLLLEEPLFDTYNLKVGRANEKLTPEHADFRPPISFEAHRDAIAAFKQTYIYDNMRRVEDRDGLFDAWIRMVDAYGGNDLLYLNPRATIPPAAVVRDRHRKNAFKEKRLFDATSFPEMKEAEEGEAEDEEGEGGDRRARVDTEG